MAINANQPVMKAPASMKPIFLLPENKNAAQIPGNTACDTASPMSAFFCRRTKAPTMAALAASNTLPSTTKRTLGSESDKKSKRLSMIYLFTAPLPLPAGKRSFLHHVAHLRQQIEPTTIRLFDRLVRKCLVRRAGSDEMHIEEHDPIEVTARRLKVVVHHNDCFSLGCHFAEQLDDGLFSSGVHPSEGFIHKIDVGFLCQCTRKENTLLLATR